MWGLLGQNKQGSWLQALFLALKKKNQDENSNFTMDKLGI